MRIALLLLIAGFAAGQTLAPTGDLQFEVASFKPTPPAVTVRMGRPDEGGMRYIASGVDLKMYLAAAFQVRSDQISGPAWLDWERWELNARAGKPSTLGEMHIMLQNLLIERMKLRYHVEKKEMQAYVPTVAKNGPKNMKAHPNGAGSELMDREAPQAFHAKWTAHCGSMDLTTSWLSQEVDRPVVDQTGLKECFDFELNCVGNPPPQAVKQGAAPDISGPLIFEALEEQLGLKLEGKRAPVNMMVIDYAERPNEN